MKKTLFLIFCSILLGVIGGVSHASLVVRDPAMKMFVNPGESTQYTIILENTDSKPLSVTAGTSEVYNKEGKPHIRSCAKWIKLESEKFSIPAKSVKALKFNLKVPKEAKGSYWAEVGYIHKAGKLQNDINADIGLNMNIFQVIRLMVSGTIQNDISIGTVSIESTGGKVSINTQVTNTGNAFQEIRLYYLIADRDGKVLDVIKSSTEKAYPLNGGNIFASKELTLQKGDYKVLGIIDYDFGNVKEFEKKFSVK